MKNILNITITTSFILALMACNSHKKNFDASGSFEAEETIISAEAAGVVKQLNVEEGQTLQAGQVLGYIDTVQLFLKKEQLIAQTAALLSKKPNTSVQLASLQQQLKTAEREKERISKLLQADAVATKQLDDINAQVTVLIKQIEAQKSSFDITTDGISKDSKSLTWQVEQINDQLKKCTIINPVNGTVINKYSQAFENVSLGKPLYKIADLSNIILRTYITGNQLPLVKLNQQVKVFTDDGNNGMKETVGIVTWISNKAEFTPKTIQTKNERANLVYAIKVKVKNDGSYKIGMYGEIIFN